MPAWLAAVLQCVKAAGATLNHENCDFSQSRFHGHLVDEKRMQS